LREFDIKYSVKEGYVFDFSISNSHRFFFIGFWLILDCQKTFHAIQKMDKTTKLSPNLKTTISSMRKAGVRAKNLGT